MSQEETTGQEDIPQQPTTMDLPREVSGDTSTEDETDGYIDGGSALDPANFQTVLLILLNRIYDVNLAFLASVNPTKAEELYALHESGAYLSPPPALAVSVD
jgi:hypothetical protein